MSWLGKNQDDLKIVQNQSLCHVLLQLCHSLIVEALLGGHCVRDVEEGEDLPL